jgi:hypothetical protein
MTGCIHDDSEEQKKRQVSPQPKVQMTIGCLVIPLLLALLVFGASLYLRSKASARLIVPEGEVVFVRASPEDSAPLLARFGAGRALEITGRTEDWRWLEVALWDGRHGWTLRPLDILVWQIDTVPAIPTSLATLPPVVTPVAGVMIAIPATSFTMQYWQCVEAGVCAAATSDASPTEAHYLNDPGFDNHPVVNVPWGEANNYCLWRRKRLPTEAEWEFVAGWDVERKAKVRWPWGNDAEQAHANVGGTSLSGPAAVGSFPADASPAGVLDMGGNVSEWVFDWYKVNYYSVADATNPVGPTHLRGAGTGRVMRGGSFADTLQEARTSNRRNQAEAYGYPTVGFRCARDGTK